MADTKQKKTLPVQHISQEEADLNLSELFYRLVEKIWIVILCALVGAGIMGVYSYGYSVPVYEATSKVYILSSSDSMINLADLQLGSSLAADYMEIFKIWEVNQEVVDNLNLPYSRNQAASMISVYQPPETRILYISARSTNPVESALVANEYAAVFREYVEKTMNADKPTLMSRALTPEYPINTSSIQNVLIGLAVGLLIGVIIVVLQFLTDDKLKTAEEIQRDTGLTTLSVIPRDTNIKDDAANTTAGGYSHE